jgi:hypothetical protein
MNAVAAAASHLVMIDGLMIDVMTDRVVVERMCPPYGASFRRGLLIAMLAQAWAITKAAAGRSSTSP